MIGRRIYSHWDKAALVIAGLQEEPPRLKTSHGAIAALHGQNLQPQRNGRQETPVPGGELRAGQGGCSCPGSLQLWLPPAQLSRLHPGRDPLPYPGQSFKCTVHKAEMGCHPPGTGDVAWEGLIGHLHSGSPEHPPLPPTALREKERELAIHLKPLLINRDRKQMELELRLSLLPCPPPPCFLTAFPLC